MCCEHNVCYINKILNKTLLIQQNVVCTLFIINNNKVILQSI